MLPPPGDPLPPPIPPAARPGLWQRFQARPRWQRWTAYGGAAVIVLTGIGGVIGEQPADDSVTDAPTTSLATPAATTAAMPTPPSTAPPTSTSTSETAAPPTTAATTIAPTTVPVTDAPTTIPGSLLALDVLALIPVANEEQAGYARDRFGYPADRDGDGCDTRAEVLQLDSLAPAQVDPSGCQVIAGDWYSSYDGVTHTDPAEVQIDHVVSAAPPPRGGR